VTPEDFFRDNEVDPMGPSVLDRLRAGSDANRSDVEVGVALLRLAHDELEAFGTDGSERTSEEEIRLVLRASRQVLDRIGLSLDLPFSDFRTFKCYWVANDGYGSWQACRNIGNDCVAVLERLSDAAFDPDKHLPDGDEVPPVAKTKLRFGMIIDSSASG